MNSVLERVYEIGIIPVIAFNSVDEADSSVQGFDGWRPAAAEVTFRTACAESASEDSRRDCPICCWAPALC